MCRSFFVLAQETLRDFIEKIDVFILGVFLKPFITSFLAIDTSKVFGFFAMQDINKKEGFSHPFFLDLLGLFEQGLSACSVLKKCRKVFKPLKIYIHFLASFFIFSVLTDNDWQEESNPLYNHSSLDIVKSLLGIFPFRFLK